MIIERPSVLLITTLASDSASLARKREIVMRVCRRVPLNHSEENRYLNSVDSIPTGNGGTTPTTCPLLH